MQLKEASGALEAEESSRVFRVEFEMVKETNIHEALIALNAVAAANRRVFDGEGYNWKSGEVEIGAATRSLLDTQADVFCGYLQRQARDKSREGVLTENIVMSAKSSTLEYLHHALLYYVDDTPRAIVNEMRSTMGNQAALVRTFEAVTAENMLTELRREGLSGGFDQIPDRPALGFGRILLEPQITDDI